MTILIYKIIFNNLKLSINSALKLLNILKYYQKPMQWRYSDKVVKWSFAIGSLVLYENQCNAIMRIKAM